MVARQAMMTFAPAVKKRRADSAPMPLVQPVTIITYVK